MSGTFRADLPVAGRRVLVAAPAESHVEGELAARVLELHAAGARVVVATPTTPASVTDLVQRAEVEHVVSHDPDLVRDVDLVVSIGSAPDIAAQAEAAGVWCIETAVPQHQSGAAGRVVLVGGGPGASGLLTRAGEDALRAADVVIFDRLAPVAAVRTLAPTAELIDVAKVPRGQSTPQVRINELLVEHAQQGKLVVRLKGGDSYVFGRGGEEALACGAAGVPVAVIPGISSALSVPALAGIPLTHRGVSQGFSVISGHLPPDDPATAIDVDALVRSQTTIVLLMAVATLADYCTAFVAAGMDPRTPAATIADGSLPGERVVRATVADLAGAVVAAGIKAPAITVVGDVVGLDLPTAP